MGFGLYASFEPHIDTAKNQTDGVAVLNALEDLDKIASGKGVIALSAFTDQREVPEDFDGDPEDLEEVLGPRADWHPIPAGLSTITELIAHLQSGAPPRVPKAKHVLADLQSIATCLRAAAASGRVSLFRLQAG